MESYGIIGHTKDWIENLLKDRSQEVVINNSHSSSKTVLSGVPQGSVLGPTLFLIYINDLPEVEDTTVKLFADDTKTYNVITKDEDQTKLQSTTDKFLKWSRKWSLEFNEKKCKRLHLGKKFSDYKYFMETKQCRSEILNVEEEKDLWVLIDHKLTFESHITSKINIANRNLGIIRQTFTYLDKEIFLHLYKSLVRPHLEFASSVWSPHLKKHKIILENIQRRATKILPAIGLLSYEERLIYLGLPSLEYRRLRADMIQVYKILHNHEKTTNAKLLELSNYNRT